jgi:hypothetical protein
MGRIRHWQLRVVDQTSQHRWHCLAGGRREKWN